MISTYYYDNQIRQYLLQFVSIFYGLKVRTGVGECNVAEFISVPAVIGNKDRVVAAIMAGNTQNRVFSIPAMAVYLSGLDLAPGRRRTPGILDQRVHLKAGGVFPDDLTVIKRAMPVPYDATIELTVYASNTDQMFQILEQVLVLFNPDLQIQKSDGEFDWTRLTRVELTGITNEENYPSGQDKRIIMWTFQFLVPIYLSVPAGVKDDLVRKIVIQMGSLGSMVINEVDEDGQITPFGDPIATIEFDTQAAPDRQPGTDRYEPPSRGPVPEQPNDTEYPGPKT